MQNDMNPGDSYRWGVWFVGTVDEAARAELLRECGVPGENGRPKSITLEDASGRKCRVIRYTSRLVRVCFKLTKAEAHADDEAVRRRVDEVEALTQRRKTPSATRQACSWRSRGATPRCCWIVCSRGRAMPDHTDHPDAGAPVERRAFQVLSDAHNVAEAIAFLSSRIITTTTDYEVTQYAEGIAALAEKVQREVEPVRDAIRPERRCTCASDRPARARGLCTGGSGARKPTAAGAVIKAMDDGLSWQPRSCA